MHESIRLENPIIIDRSQIETILADGDFPVIQFSTPRYTPGLLEQLNAACAEFGSRLEVRFFGHGPIFDANCLLHLPNVASLSVDCLPSATNLDVLFELRDLRRFSLGIFNLDQPDILDCMHLENVEELFVCETRKSNIDLSALQRCSVLRKLYISGHTRGFDTLPRVHTVAELSLRSIPKKQSLAAVSQMRGLNSLRIALGGRPDINEVVHDGLKKLEVLWVRGLTTIGRLDRFPELRHLGVEHQLHIETIDLTKAPRSLRRVIIYDCKKLRTLGEIEHLHQLVELRISCTAIDSETLLRSPPPSLRYVGFFTGRKKENAAIRARLDALGYLEFSGYRFDDDITAASDVDSVT